MTKPDLKAIQGGKVEAVPVPEEVEFPCYYCKASCKVYPRNVPIAVVHALPACSIWKRAGASITIADRPPLFMEEFLAKSGVQLSKPPAAR